MPKSLFVLLITFFGFQVQAQEGRSIINMNLGPVQFHVYIGNLVNQSTQGLMVSHRNSYVEAHDGVAGAITQAGGRNAFAEVEKQIESGKVRFGDAIVEPVSYGSNLKASAIINVIELRSYDSVVFNSVQQLEAAKLDINPDLLQKYRDFLIQHQDVLMATGTQQPIATALDVFEIREQQRRLIISIMRATAFSTVVESVFQGLLAAGARGITSVSIPTLGYSAGRGQGILALRESVSAIATGIQQYQHWVARYPGNSTDRKIVTEVRTVVWGTDDAPTRARIRNSLAAHLKSGLFLSTAYENFLLVRRSGLNSLLENIANFHSKGKQNTPEITPMNVPVNDILSRPEADRTNGRAAQLASTLLGLLGWGNGRAISPEVNLCVSLFAK